MQVSVETTTGLERRLTVGVPAERVEKEVAARLKKAAGNVRIDGFRPGKVPFKVVKQRFGAGVRQEVIGEMISQTFYEAVQQEDIRPAGQPNIEPKNLEEGADVEYVATFEVYPNIEVAPFDNVQVETPQAQVGDADVSAMIDKLRSQQTSWEAVERAAADGDQVNIDYEGSKDGELFEGGAAQGSDLVLGSGSMIPGFEDGIVGLKSNDTKVLELIFPEDYHSEELKAAAVKFNVTVNSVSEKTMPELNDEFFAKFGITEGGEDAFREDVHERMEKELSQGIKSKVKEQVMNGLLENNQFDVPQSLVSQEIGQLKNQAFQQFGGGAANLDSSMLPDELFQDQAERRVKLGLLLAEVIAKEGITAEKDKVRAAVEELAAGYEDKEEVINYYYGNEQQLAIVESMVLEEQVVESVLSNCVVSEKESTYDEVMNPEPPAEEEDEEEA